MCNFFDFSNDKFIGGSVMILRSYWGRLLSFVFRNEDNSKDSCGGYNLCTCVTYAGLGP